MDIAIKGSATNLSKQNAINVYSQAEGALRLTAIFPPKRWATVVVEEDNVVVTDDQGISRVFSGKGTRALIVGGSRP